MSKFNINDRVVMIERGEIYRGTIHNVFEELRTAVVRFDNGDYEKVSFNRIVHEPETKAPDIKVQEEKTTKSREDLNKIIEETEITIIGKDFMKIVVENARDVAGDNFEIKLALLMFGAKLHKALFYDAVEND